MNTEVKETSRNVRGINKSPTRNSQMITTVRQWNKEQKDATILAQSLNAEPFYRRAVRRLGWKEVAQSE